MKGLARIALCFKIGAKIIIKESFPRSSRHVSIPEHNLSVSPLTLRAVSDPTSSVEENRPIKTGGLIPISSEHQNDLASFFGMIRNCVSGQQLKDKYGKLH